jgi:hypothetical protein
MVGCLPASRSATSPSCAPVEQECRISIANQSTRNVAVYYRGAGKTRELLGSVPAGGSTMATIADPSVRGTVSLVAESEAPGDGGWVVCSRTLKLAGAAATEFLILDRCNPRRNPQIPPKTRAAEPPTTGQIPSSGDLDPR